MARHHGYGLSRASRCESLALIHNADCPIEKKKTPYPFGYGVGYWLAHPSYKLDQQHLHRGAEDNTGSTFLDSPYGEMV